MHKGQVQVQTVTLTNRGQTMATPFTRPVTRADKENSKKEFDDLLLLIQQEFQGLEGWLLKNANPKLTNLAKLLTGDLKDADKRWEYETEIRIVKTYAKTGQTKVDYVESLIGRLKEQVIRSPIAESDAKKKIPVKPGCTKPGNSSHTSRITRKPSTDGSAGA